MQPPYGQPQPPPQGFGPPQPYPGPPQYTGPQLPNQPQYPGPPQYPGQPQSPWGPPPGGGDGGGGKGKVVAIVIGTVVAVAIIGTGIAVAMHVSGSNSNPVSLPTSVLPSDLPSDLPSNLPSAQPSASSSDLTYNAVTLKTGECYSDPAITPSVTDITKRSCTVSHDGEVTAVVTLPGGLSTTDAIGSKADSLCHPINSAVYQRQSSSAKLSGSVFYPLLDGYQGGDHKAYCVLTIDTGGSKLTAPLR
jgi:hypothetical protein